MSAAPLRRLAAAAAGALALGACLDVATGPGGATSLRLRSLPPSVVVGDTLRDSTGAPAGLSAVALDEDETPLETPAFRFFYVPLRADTARRDPDSALVVDSVTGIVRAPGPAKQADRGRVGVRLGGFQILDTLLIVQRPTALTRTAAASEVIRLEYPCDDRTRPTFSDSGASTNGVRIGNVTPALGVTLRGDSSQQAVSIPRYLVRYEIVAPQPLPIGDTPGGQRRPAIYVTGAAADTPLGYDTTGTDGTASPRLRIVPALLTRAAFPDSITEVRVRATATVRRDTVVAAPVEFRVRLQRRSVGLSSGQPLSCP